MIVHRRFIANIAAGFLIGAASLAAFAQKEEPPASPPPASPPPASPTTPTEPATPPAKDAIAPGGVEVHVLRPKDTYPFSGDDSRISRLGWVKGIRYLIPPHWKPEKAANPMRLAQIRLPERPGSGKGDAVLAMSGDIGGTVEENIARWVGQFTDIEDVPTQQDLLLVKENMIVTQVVVTGTYHGMGEEAKPNTTMLGAIVQNGPEGTVFIKAVGPKETIAFRRSSWDLVIRNLRVIPRPERPEDAVPEDAPAPEKK